MRKVLPLDSNSRQSVIAFHGGFRDERRHVRSLYKHSDLYSWGPPSPLLRHCSYDRTICRPCNAQIGCTWRGVRTCLFVSCETDGRERDRITEIARYYTPSALCRTEAAIIKPSVDARWILIIRKLHLPERPEIKTLPAIFARARILYRLFARD